MKRDVTALLKEALALPATDRAALAEALVASLEEHSDEEVVAVWKIEIERRISELDAGVVSMIPWLKFDTACSIALVVAPSNDCARVPISGGCQPVPDKIDIDAEALPLPRAVCTRPTSAPARAAQTRPD